MDPQTPRLPDVIEQTSITRPCTGGLLKYSKLDILSGYPIGPDLTRNYLQTPLATPVDRLSGHAESDAMSGLIKGPLDHFFSDWIRIDG